MVEKYRELYRDVFKEYGSKGVYEPYAVLDRLAGFLSGSHAVERYHVRQQRFSPNRYDDPSRSFHEDGTTRSHRARAPVEAGGLEETGEIAKIEGLIELKAGNLAKARAKFDEAAKRLGEHPKASAYSLARVILAQAEIACFQKRWDDAEVACDRLFHLFHEMDSRSLDVLSLDALAKAEGQAAYHLGLSLALPGSDASADRDVRGVGPQYESPPSRDVRPATRRAPAGDQPAVVKVREQLFDAWRRFAVLAVQRRLRTPPIPQHSGDGPTRFSPCSPR